jgi:hypothetical protein
MDITEEVLKNVAALDKDQPGWHRKINLRTLNMGHCSSCVLGQVYNLGPESRYVPGTYLDVWDRLQAIDSELTHAFIPEEDAAWRHLIAERQEADKFPLASPIEVTEEVYA